MGGTKGKKRAKKPTRRSSSSKGAGRSRISPGLAELGLQIAEDIGADAEQNTTGKWIAQFLAERLKAAEQDPSKSAECVDLILKLWHSRRHWPSGNPFEKYDELIKQFDDRARPPRYGPGKRRESQNLQDCGWFQLAEKLDELSDTVRYELIKQGAIEMGIADDELLELSAREASDPEVQLLSRLRQLAESGPPELKDPMESLGGIINAIQAKIEASK